MTAPPPGPELYRYNRRLIAQRCGWPDDAVEMCEQLETEHPGWDVSWMRANDIHGWEHPAGYSATRDDVNLAGADHLRRLPEDGVTRRPSVFGATPAELREQIAAMDARVAAQKARDEAFWEWTRTRPY